MQPVIALNEVARRQDSDRKRRLSKCLGIEVPPIKCEQEIATSEQGCREDVSIFWMNHTLIHTNALVVWGGDQVPLDRNEIGTESRIRCGENARLEISSSLDQHALGDSCLKTAQPTNFQQEGGAPRGRAGACNEN